MVINRLTQLDERACSHSMAQYGTGTPHEQLFILSCAKTHSLTEHKMVILITRIVFLRILLELSSCEFYVNCLLRVLLEFVFCEFYVNCVLRFLIESCSAISTPIGAPIGVPYSDPHGPL